MNNHPLNELSFLKPINEIEKTSMSSIINEADKAYQADNKKNNSTIKNSKAKCNVTPLQKKNSKKTLSLPSNPEKKLFDPSTTDEEITLKTIEENAEKFKASFKEITNDFKEQIKDLSFELQESKKSLELLAKITEQEKPSFFSTLFKKKKNASTSFVKNGNQLIPVIKESITSPSQIINSKTLLHYASDWTRTIFSDRVLFKALPGSGTILVVLPKGNIHFIQFNYKDTPIHPTQEDFKSHLNPIKVHEFHHFIDYRNWIYNEIRKI